MKVEPMDTKYPNMDWRTDTWIITRFLRLSAIVF